MKNREEKVLSNQCRICGASAEYSHYGVISCYACQIFFRRHANSSKVPSLNLLQSDKSLLTQNQWRLIFNLCNVCNESNLFSTGQLLFNTYYDSKSTNIVDETLMNEFLVSVYETVRTYLHLNDDRSIILHSAANNITCLTGSFVLSYCHLLFVDAFENTINLRFGKNTINIHHWADKFIDSDVVLIKLSISLFAVSQYTYLYSPNMLKDLTNPINILEIQNKYAEVIWIYLLYRYGYYEAIKRFLKLTLWFIAGWFLSYDGQKSMKHVNSVHTVVEQTELKLILDDVDQIVEENK
ncbi:unnamed protein product [Rotaria sordida]|uniref:Nuclear receptor domain-containing protein n=1 Tax=Rotaria sordida TaxID=392033 RepID=A0A814UXZ9_9BILA|nr:unnamed protein product [Rotaria sordida]CAF1440147.1 unnamed protein product [Rotaria sordida]